MSDLESELRANLSGEHSSVIIEFQPHAMNYVTVAEAIEQDLLDPRDWISDAEREASVRTNRVWQIQWYPATPICFYSLYASTLSAALDAYRAARESVQGDE